MKVINKTTREIESSPYTIILLVAAIVAFFIHDPLFSPLIIGGTLLFMIMDLLAKRFTQNQIKKEKSRFREVRPIWSDNQPQQLQQNVVVKSGNGCLWLVVIFILLLVLSPFLFTGCCGLALLGGG
jgi:hypothetical protein